MRALLVGYGSIGKRHATNLLALQTGVALDVLLPRGSASAAAVPAGARVVHEMQQALDGRPDLAIVAGPSALRMALLGPLFDAGVPSYVEKPLVATAAEAAALRARLDRAPLVAVGCNLRLLPSLRRLRSLLAEGTIGTVVRAAFTAGQWLPDWRPGADYRRGYGARSESGGGVILDLIHEIDMARWLLGELDLVAAARGKLSRLEIEAEDTACLLLRGRRGAPLASVALDYVSRRRVRRYEIVGDEGTLVWDLDRAVLERSDARGIQVLEQATSAFDVAATYPAALAEFLGCIAGRGQPSCDLRDGLASAELALQARERATVAA